MIPSASSGVGTIAKLPNDAVGIIDDFNLWLAPNVTADRDVNNRIRRTLLGVDGINHGFALRAGDNFVCAPKRPSIEYKYQQRSCKVLGDNDFCDGSGVRMVAQREMLPQSTERIVEVQGTPEGIKGAIWEICKCLIDDWHRGTGTVLHNPGQRSKISQGVSDAKRMDWNGSLEGKTPGDPWYQSYALSTLKS
ncbi:KH domain-containing protein [Colletotrichum orchidophilum]|uniref:KH domain-containing protein n=1 Tax=Colletotrichum orchidophilum TaxID=1209926 RepID=A0A1G4BS69_9PEZI|nr:KH domain-containing protein [Colletotrichum orchidophilum]OHF04274.1 KH domain-containing protein [Colletotrichum orchidophilum]